MNKEVKTEKKETMENISVATPQKLLCLELEEARQEIFTAVSDIANTHNIPFFLLEGVIFEILTQVKEGKRKEVDAAQQLYQKQLNEYMQLTSKTSSQEA